ncbi:thioredoxin [Actinomycetospora chibensis]|uniref:Thioredoxin n=1 Tax=Actinomycetospora chibensis TaxID=663606 RepID=A0ABV9RP48_9PSEU|nr:thioredoxin [Actinomycetospora chibensis]MDD7922267.1 thioredoxin [Actinomycetospora chibensis]
MSLPVSCPQCGRANRIPPAAAGSPRCGHCRAALPWIVDADDRDFADIAEGARLPVLVDLWAAWCGPCRMVAPVVERAAREYAGQLKVVKVDVDAAPSVAARFEARSIPTLLLLRSGRVVGRQVGAPPGDRLLAWVGAELGRESTEHR